MAGLLRRWLLEYKALLIFILLMSVFRSSLADWNSVPTGSMQPTIVEGDRILVNKMAYDIRLPFTHYSLFNIADPKAGDIVIFDSKNAKKRLVKRVIGVPGDSIELRHNRLLINGQAVKYKPVNLTSSTVDGMENLAGVDHFVRFSRGGSSLSSFSPIRIPEKQYLVLGDNRDNSADSRVYGLVPREEMVGRTRTVVMSFDYENFYLPRTNRFFHSL